MQTAQLASCHTSSARFRALVLPSRSTPAHRPSLRQLRKRRMSSEKTGAESYTEQSETNHV